MCIFPNRKLDRIKFNIKTDVSPTGNKHHHRREAMTDLGILNFNRLRLYTCTKVMTSHEIRRVIQPVECQTIVFSLVISSNHA